MCGRSVSGLMYHRKYIAKSYVSHCPHYFLWHHGAPHGGPSPHDDIGTLPCPLCGLAGTLKSWVTCSLVHSGHSTLSPVKTTISNLCSHLSQAYSYRGIVTVLSHERRRLYTSLARSRIWRSVSVRLAWPLLATFASTASTLASSCSS